MTSKINTRAKALVQSSAKHPLGWLFYRTCGKLSENLGRIYGYAQIVRHDAEVAQFAAELFPDLTVASGPFKGLKYPSAQSVGSNLLPKLLGSYESELHSVLSGMLTIPYTAVVDIGCAEGYYANGLALKLPHSQVFAFDTDLRAKKLCSEMANLNGVADRIHIGGFCDEVALRAIPLGNRALIVSDCEGYEGSLFNSGLAEFLAPHDVIVETHDFINIELSGKMREAFAGTHRILSVKSSDDLEKVHAYRDSALDGYAARDKHFILKEERPAIMEWLIMTSKTAVRPIA